MTEDKDKYIEELKQSLLYKTITAWDNNSLTLSDGTKVIIECTDTTAALGQVGSSRMSL